jgi:hypothetical protein
LCREAQYDFSSGLLNQKTGKGWVSPQPALQTLRTIVLGRGGARTHTHTHTHTHPTLEDVPGSDREGIWADLEKDFALSSKDPRAPSEYNGKSKRQAFSFCVWIFETESLFASHVGLELILLL